ncbi:hypothetical protein N643_05815 [Salmonella bongori serovar 48:z41:-- str. RKS3044]|nr:hypothetical protein N643_05815 [Salmonella bongori serovar 48:z41:-- str. RKS3044]
MGKNTSLGFQPKIKQDKHTQVHHKKSEERAKVHKGRNGFDLAGKKVAEQQGDDAGEQNGVIRRFTRGMDVREEGGQHAVASHGK